TGRDRVPGIVADYRQHTGGRIKACRNGHCPRPLEELPRGRRRPAYKLDRPKPAGGTVTLRSWYSPPSAGCRSVESSPQRYYTAAPPEERKDRKVKSTIPLRRGERVGPDVIR